MLIFLVFAWIVIFGYQVCLGYGTAYRLTKEGADNGTSLFGWLLLMNLAAAIPGLGFYLWHKNKNLDVPEDKLANQTGASTSVPAAAQTKGKNLLGFGRSDKGKKSQKPNPNITCDKCGRTYESYIKACPGCGKRDMDRRHS